MKRIRINGKTATVTTTHDAIAPQSAIERIVFVHGVEFHVPTSAFISVVYADGSGGFDIVGKTGFVAHHDPTDAPPQRRAVPPGFKTKIVRPASPGFAHKQHQD